jgi:uncharacterized protein (DUF1499 family)
VAILIAMRFVPTPASIGLKDGRLSACPETPNCVSTRESNAAFQIEPIPFGQDEAAVQAIIVDLLRQEPRTEIVSNQPGYIHAIARSAGFGFPDDIEFAISAGTIHFRSASRVGQGDLGVNRTRMERLRSAIIAQLAP